jgi:hypothetical protein
MRSWVPEAERYFAATAHGPKYIVRRLMTTGVLSVGLVTFRFAPTNADRFWYELAHDDGLPANAPHKQLLHYLHDDRSRNSMAADIACYVASAWNLFCREKTVTRLLPAGHNTEAIVIEGTPHKGKRMRYIGPDGALLTEPILLP